MPNHKKIMFVGGGTMGPVTPLLAVWEAWSLEDSGIEGVWVGTPHGPEAPVVTREGLRFFSLPVARFVRYPSVEWLLLPIRFVAAFVRALILLIKERPNLIASAGGYTAVPVVLVGRLFGIKIWVHQQDVDVILTNRLTAPFAHILTVAWQKNLKEFGSKAQLVGNPVRPSVLQGDAKTARKKFGFIDKKPVVLLFGGGSGSFWLNTQVAALKDELLQEANIIHVTGPGKKGELSSQPGYVVEEFLDEDMVDALTVADVVVCRAGTGTISELAALKKAAIVIPLPNSPQEQNAEMIAEASVVLKQASTDTDDLLTSIQWLLRDGEERERLGCRMQALLPSGVAHKIVLLLKSYL